MFQHKNEYFLLFHSQIDTLICCKSVLYKSILSSSIHISHLKTIEYLSSVFVYSTRYIKLQQFDWIKMHQKIEKNKLLYILRVSAPLRMCWKISVFPMKTLQLLWNSVLLLACKHLCFILHRWNFKIF